ncbi:hypothetical protein, partial [Achromobacter sp.]|uniref:hypothetical protein n=1 Tax=Achromobacter sp. TaxID=134375 RepID=UPI00289F6DEC
HTEPASPLENTSGLASTPRPANVGIHAPSFMPQASCPKLHARSASSRISVCRSLSPTTSSLPEFAPQPSLAVKLQGLPRDLK